MVLARSRAAARILSEQVATRQFEKEYLAVLEGVPEHDEGELRDLLGRDKTKKLTYVAGAPGKDVRAAVLRYRLLDSRDGFSLVKIHLLTGRTHQIRCQFSSRGLPLAGDCKYGARCREMEGIGLWSHWIAFRHPQTDAPVSFQAPPPRTWPWTLFPALWTEEESLKQIAIIGGGAAGLAAAALSAARTDPKAEITVLEGLDRVGKKILSTGNGRCNLTNSDLANAHYHSSQPELLEIFLRKCPLSAHWISFIRWDFGVRRRSWGGSTPMHARHPPCWTFC